MKLIRWNEHDAYFNLAAEEYVFTTLDPTEEYVLLWQNENAVIVGKHQNTIEEINTNYVKENNVQVVRRNTGGGAVYHDLGNLNFSFIVDSKEGAMKFRELSQPVADTLIRLGVDVQFTGRNDLTIDGKKFSGNAQYIRGGRVLHHGTLLFNANLDVISQVLAVKNDKITSKGVKSVRSRVTNICEYLPGMTIDTFQALLEETLLSNRELSRYEFNDADIAAIRALRDKKYATWEWNYGTSPEFDIKKERRFSTGGLSLFMQVNKGIIQSIRIYGDFFGNGDIDHLENALRDVPLREDAVRNALQKFDINQYVYGISVDDLTDAIAN